MTAPSATTRSSIVGRDTMRATVFRALGDIRVEDVPRPHAGPWDDR